MNHDLSRRDAMGGLAALGALGLSGSGAMGGQPKIRPARFIPTDIGYDAQTKRYVLPELPYAYDALEPIIDEQTMRIHHDKHHAGYVKGANNALDQLEQIRWGNGDPAVVQHWLRQLSFHMGGHLNHTLFWTGMKPVDAGGIAKPNDNLLAQIVRDFGSFDRFTDSFTSAATKVEASGWGWLVYEPASRQLMVIQMQNQQDMMFASAVPLLGVDVWEHAYYLKYQNRRSEYVKEYMRLVNWDEVSRRFEAARV